MMHIYKVTNKVDGKIYIGQTKNVRNRWKGHIRDAFSHNPRRRFQTALRQFGPDGFTIEVIETCDSRREASEREIYWIRVYDSSNPEHGYNSTKGGSGEFTGTKGIVKALKHVMKKDLDTYVPRNGFELAAVSFIKSSAVVEPPKRKKYDRRFGYMKNGEWIFKKRKN